MLKFFGLGAKVNRKNKCVRKKSFVKRGFTLIELLVAVAILGLMIPVLLRAFVISSELNRKAWQQEVVDAAAVETFETIAGLPFDKLSSYLSEVNDWTPLPFEQDSEDNVILYKAKMNYQEYENFTITATVREHSKKFEASTLELLGMNTDYLTLNRQINQFDTIAKAKIENAIKSDSNIQQLVKQDIIRQIPDINQSVILTERIVLSYGAIDETKIGKVLDLSLSRYDLNGKRKVSADYEVSYRYPASQPDPRNDTATFPLSYVFTYYNNGVWEKVSGTVDASVTTSRGNSKGTLTIDSVGDVEKVFLYYQPLTEQSGEDGTFCYDWIDIKTDESLSTSSGYWVFLIEQGITHEDNEFGELRLNYTEEGKTVNNINYFICGEKQGDQVVITNNSKSFRLYSNNKYIVPNGLSDDAYESSKTMWLYTLEVTVEFDDAYFSTVTGQFDSTIINK